LEFVCLPAGGQGSCFLGFGIWPQKEVFMTWEELTKKYDTENAKQQLFEKKPKLEKNWGDLLILLQRLKEKWKNNVLKKISFT